MRDVDFMKRSLECLRMTKEFTASYNARNRGSGLCVSDHELSLIISDFEREIERVKEGRAAMA